MKRLACSICAALTVCLLSWLGGFDFNERGGAALLVGYFSLGAGVLTYLIPGWEP